MNGSRVILLSVIIMLALSLGATANGSAAAGGETLVVTSTLDTIDISPGDGICADAAGECTLRAAILEANALPGHRILIVGGGEYKLTRAGCCEDSSLTGDLDISGDISIYGSGTLDTVLTETVGLGGVERVLDVHEGGHVLVSGLSIRNVHMSALLPESEDCGGGIRNSAHLTLAQLVVENNTFRRDGAGICNHGVLRLSESVINNNNAALIGAGGGLLNFPGAFAVIEKTTITGNRSDTLGGGGVANWGRMVVSNSIVAGNDATASSIYGGGGIMNGTTNSPVASLLIVNSTISGNSTDSPSGGGAISNRLRGSVIVVSSTISNNGLPGGGMYTQADSTTNLIRTIVSNNNSFDCGAGSNSVQPTSLGHNLDSDGTCQLAAPGDLSGVDPLLGDLADNGGPTMTHALLPGSPAIDAGDNVQCPATDQRGAPRPAGAGCDIGAYESGSAVPAPGPLPGDVDCDGALSPFDQLALMQHLGSLATPACIEHGDVDCDGDVDVVDAVSLLRRLAGILDPPCDPG